jgi:glutamate synthase (NADPH/NADH) small chain
VFNVSPKSINNDGVILEKTTLCDPDESGRQRVQIEPNSDYLESADIIILAL